MGVLLARGPRARVRQGRAGATMAVIVPNCDFGDRELDFGDFEIFLGRS